MANSELGELALVNVDLDAAAGAPRAPDERTRTVPCRRPARWLMDGPAPAGLMGVVSVAETKKRCRNETNVYFFLSQ